MQLTYFIKLKTPNKTTQEKTPFEETCSWRFSTYGTSLKRAMKSSHRFILLSLKIKFLDANSFSLRHLLFQFRFAPNFFSYLLFFIIFPTCNRCQIFGAAIISSILLYDLIVRDIYLCGNRLSSLTSKEKLIQKWIETETLEFKLSVRSQFYCGFCSGYTAIFLWMFCVRH